MGSDRAARGSQKGAGPLARAAKNRREGGGLAALFGFDTRYFLHVLDSMV